MLSLIKNGCLLISSLITYRSASLSAFLFDNLQSLIVAIISSFSSFSAWIFCLCFFMWFLIGQWFKSLQKTAWVRVCPRGPLSSHVKRVKSTLMQKLWVFTEHSRFPLKEKVDTGFVCVRKGPAIIAVSFSSVSASRSGEAKLINLDIHLMNFLEISNWDQVDISALSGQRSFWFHKFEQVTKYN